MPLLRYWGLLIACLGICSCHPDSPADVHVTDPPGDAGAGGRAPTAFSFGIEYAHPDVAAFYRDLGARATKLTSPVASWNRIQPSEGGSFDFSLLDQVILAFQNSGFTGFHIWLQVDAAWAVDRSGACEASAARSFALRPEGESHYSAFVNELVERYDMDGGPEDLAGLHSPVTDFEALSEAQHDGEFCVADPARRVADYATILRLTHAAAKTANPEARVILSGITLEEVFEGHPTEAEVASRLACLDSKYPGQVAFVEASLELVDWYDVIEFHALEGPYQPAEFMTLLRSRGVDKPAWVGDAFALSPLGAPSGVPCGPVAYPRGAEIYDSVDRVMLSLYGSGEQPSAGDVALEEWYRTEQARSLVQKVVVAAAAGYEGINIGNTYDWPRFRTLPTRTREWSWMGLVEVDNPLNDTLDSPPMVVRHGRPAFHAYGQLIGFIDGFSQVRRLSTADDQVHLYEFLVAGVPRLVGWFDDRIADCPNATLCDHTTDGSKTVSLTAYGTTLQVEHLLERLDAAQQPIAQAAQTVGSDAVLLDESPAFMTPAGG